MSLHPSFSATLPLTETPQSAISPVSVMSDMGTWVEGNWQGDRSLVQKLA